MSWNSMLRSSPRLVSFGLGVTFNTVASSSNLKRWGYANDDSCPLCGNSPCGIDHVLSGCKISLQGGRYRKRHDCVLRALAHGVQGEVNANKMKKKKDTSGSQWPVFVKEGQNPSTQKQSRHGLLGEAKDWCVLVDLDKQLKFPEKIAITKMRPDMVLYSDTAKMVIMIELTCPVEGNIECRHQEKTGKYEELVQECRTNGWKVWFFAVEVGARGYVAGSFRYCLSRLGLPGAKVKKVCNHVSDTALRWSFWIWIGREKTEWFAQKGSLETAVDGETLSPGDDPIVSSPVSPLRELNTPTITLTAPDGPVPILKKTDQFNPVPGVKKKVTFVYPVPVIPAPEI